MASVRDEVIINGMLLRNRIAMPPLTTAYGDSKGCVTDDIIAFYRERSRDVGLVIVEATAVRADGRILPGSLGLWEDAQLAGMTRLAGAIKALGAAAVLQISHAGARGFPGGGEMQGASPSGLAFRPDVVPITIDETQIERLKTAFADAADRAAEAGFDGVEIHGAHLYLISQFLSPLTNKRDDRYGGNARERALFAREVVRAVRAKLGKDYPIFFRLNGVENVPGGQTREDAVTVARLLADAGVDALDVSLVTRGSWQEIEGRTFLSPSSAFSKKQAAGANVALTAELKEATGLPVIAVGKLGEGNLADETVRDLLIDIVAIGRQMIADPGAAGKILSGNSAEIVRCKECMSCFASIGSGKPLACKVNKKLPGTLRSD